MKVKVIVLADLIHQLGGQIRNTPDVVKAITKIYTENKVVSQSEVKGTIFYVVEDK